MVKTIYEVKLKIIIRYTPDLLVIIENLALVKTACKIVISGYAPAKYVGCYPGISLVEPGAKYAHQCEEKMK